MSDFGFHQYRDLFSAIRRGGVEAPRTIDGARRVYAEFLATTMRALPEEGQGIMLHQGKAEFDWYNSGQPYFKIWPSMIGALCHISLKLDCSLIRTQYYAFEVRFPITDNPMRESPESPELRAMLVCLHSDIQNKNDDALMLSLWMDFGESSHIQGDPLEEPVMAFIRFHLKNGTSIEDAFDHKCPIMPGLEGYYPSDAFQKAVLRLAIGVMFFSVDQHEIVAPDIPRKLIDKYAAAKRQNNPGAMREVLQKARRRLNLPQYSSGGFVIGRDIDLPKRVIRDYRDAQPNTGEKHWEISYGYVRSPHVRMQPVGPKDSPQVKAIVISAHPVRPDLPMKQPSFNIKE